MERAERYWQRALEVSEGAEAVGALVPLSTEELCLPRLTPFQLRRLRSAPPRHLRSGGPKPNPFLPWDPHLEVTRLGDNHLLLLNKYPVQRGHLLLITSAWQPQSGWLQNCDWEQVERVSQDTGGLWFFNSAPASGASQPHRHLQLLPRAAGEPSCPLAATFEQHLTGGVKAWPWAYALSRRRDEGPGELATLYQRHARALGLGHPHNEPQPLHPYNLVFDDHWFLMVRRRCEHAAGFSINALGFAGYLLLTDGSDLNYLEREGPWALLASVAAKRESAVG